MSSSRITTNSSESNLTSVPLYFPKRTISPTLTSNGVAFPSSLIFPFPTAITSPFTGFSVALSGITIPPGRSFPRPFF